ncbi:hypothetical protein FA13DRAFT_1721115 [Coprinellus micaceus]|uniref:NADP-dependent oxidoreductase domain-containing protein n=1 Tax=Coprinellus micaceus TaxID=71717 RepID=A0A4Y7S3X0_COPMI|nr:hypothetical protein FA13DRAFT_1721115 [Coprinellus micaceus]
MSGLASKCFENELLIDPPFTTRDFLGKGTAMEGKRSGASARVPTRLRIAPDSLFDQYYASAVVIDSSSVDVHQTPLCSALLPLTASPRTTQKWKAEIMHIFDSVKQSIERLRFDYIDVLQCHRFDPNTPIEETSTPCKNHYDAVYPRKRRRREMFPTLKLFGVGATPWSPSHEDSSRDLFPFSIVRGHQARRGGPDDEGVSGARARKRLWPRLKRSPRRGELAWPNRSLIAWILSRPGLAWCDRPQAHWEEIGELEEPYQAQKVVGHV